ncbi:hypothetical protein BTE56_04570 [Agrobacterium pusense]|nr:hypothetical protein BTE56_04570 [Agrobacterium pusense]
MTVVTEISAALRDADQDTERSRIIANVDYQFRYNISFSDIVIRVVLWVALSILTLGLYGLVVPYAFANFIIDRTEIVDCNQVVIGKLNHGLKTSEMMLNIIVWLLISLFTLGLGSLVAPFYIMRLILNTTRVEFS